MTARGIDPALEIGSLRDALAEDFEIFEELGRGATAIVYRAVDRRSERDVALKVVRLGESGDRETIAHLVHEARTVSGLSHPNIVSLYDVRALPDARVALVVQLVRGGTLRRALRRSGQFPIMYVERVLRDIASALSHAHARGIVHRDLKPENIFLDSDSGRSMLADFGSARPVDSDTSSGAVGTPAYMAPEQIDGLTVDARSDLYSLGLIAWEMITGERPWMGEELFSILHKQKTEELPPMDALRPDVPDRLQYVVERLMAKSLDVRWASANAFLREWADVAPDGGWRRWRAARRERSRLWLAERELVNNDVARFAARLGAGQPEDDLPTLERLDAPARRKPVAHRRRRTIGALLAVLIVAGAGVAYRLASRAAALADAPLAAQDERTIEVPVLPSSRDSVARAESLAVAAATLRADSARLDSAIADRAGRSLLAPLPADVPRPLAAVRDSSRGAVAMTEPFARPIAPPPARTPIVDTVVPDATPAAPPPSAVARPGMEAVARVAAGGRHSCGVSVSGLVTCWGANESGQLGDGTSAGHASPAPVGSSLRAVLVTNGTAHSCALTGAGEAYCWGQNDRGQLGDGTTIGRDEPTRVPTTWRFRALYAGASHTCGLTVDGRVACWGSNAYGQLGSGALGMVTAPMLVSTLPSRIAVLSVGWQHACAIDAGAALWCWGRNTSGQLGDFTTLDRRTPTRIGGAMRFMAVSAGATHSCAVATDGSLWCWGKNSSGQLGTGSTIDALSPARVDIAGDFVGVAAGASHSCAPMRGGALYCWGRNVYGQLGDGTTTDRTHPVPVATTAPIVAVQASAAHTCALTSLGENLCWGYNAEGQLGDGTRDNRTRPTRVALPPPS